MTRPFSAPGESPLRRRSPLRRCLLRPLVAVSAALAVAGGATGCAVENESARGVPATDIIAASAAPDQAAADPVPTAPADPPPETASPTPSAAPGSAGDARQKAPPRPEPTRRPARRPAREKPAPADRGPSTAQEREVTRLINIARRKHGCGAVRTDDKLLRAARGHSADMASRNYFSHTGKDGRQPWDRAAAAGFRSRSVSENIAMGTGVDARRVVRMWLDSPGHRANILRCGATVTAVGRAGKGRTAYWTQMFGGR